MSLKICLYFCFKACKEETDRNQNLNNQLHHKLADYYRRRKNDDTQANQQQMFDKSTIDQEQRYNKYLGISSSFLF